MKTKWACDLCREVFDSKEDATKHEKSHGPQIIVIVNGKMAHADVAYLWDPEPGTTQMMRASLLLRDVRPNCNRYPQTQDAAGWLGKHRLINEENQP